MRSRTIAACIPLLLLVSECLSAQTPAPAGADTPTSAVTAAVSERLYKVSESGVSAPRVIVQTDPKYSKEARKKKVQGTTVLRVVVGKDGQPGDIYVQHILGSGLDQEAIKAVKHWRWEPARKDGQPVQVLIDVAITFKLY